jgi:hypothetical protein
MAEDQPSNELAPREPTVEDLRNLCRELNQRGAKYAAEMVAEMVSGTILLSKNGSWNV